MKFSGEIKKTDGYLALGLFFIAFAAYYAFDGYYVLYFQETQSLFLFTREYLHNYLIKPGGLLEYAARFLTQFYISKAAGAIISALIITIPGLILFNRYKTNIKNGFILPLIVLPSILITLMQANYFHQMEANIGFSALFSLLMLTEIYRDRKINYITVLSFPLIWYIFGGYSFIFAAGFILRLLIYDKSRDRIVIPFLLIIVGAVTFFIFYQKLFLLPLQQILLSPLPSLNGYTYAMLLISLILFTLTWPFIFNYAGRISENRFNSRLLSLTAVTSMIALSGILTHATHNARTERVIELERFIFNDQWQEAIDYYERKPSNNLIGEYFYNVALSETGQMCDRLFGISQDFSTESLVLPWSDEHLNRGGWFYYSIGLMNEAFRWAYEEMVVSGARPQNLKLLVKTSLVTGDYQMAKKHAAILGKTLFYRKWAEKYTMLADNPDLIEKDPELAAKRRLLPSNDFFIQFSEPQNNLPLILADRPDNKKAFEYYMAGLLLTKNVEAVINNINKLAGMGYTRIPRHMEEAAVAWYNSTKRNPDLGGLPISKETLNRFNEYFETYKGVRQNSPSARKKMQEKFRNTYWYYLHFK